MTLCLTAVVALATLAACAGGAVNAGPPPSSRPASQPASQPASPEPAVALLDRLETATEGLRDFRADVTFYTWDGVIQRREIRTGEIVYQQRPGNQSKRFAILVTREIIGNRQHDQNKRYIFDGSWFVEIDYDNRVFIKRQIVRPGENFDPLKLGEGPFPLPLGQRRDEVLARFEASLLDESSDEQLAKFLTGKSVLGLLLVPRPSTPQAREIVQVEIFYDSVTLLPVGIHLTETNGDRKTVRLRNLRRNEGIDEASLSIEQPDGFAVDVIPWRD